jgi:hypothetical protein
MQMETESLRFHGGENRVGPQQGLDPHPEEHTALVRSWSKA